MTAVVGRIVELWRYPVKSMAGERLRATDVDIHGLPGDRRWAFVRPGRVDSGFPWLTIRENPQMALCRPELLEPERPEASSTVVHTPEGSFGVTDPRLAALLGDGVQVMKQNRGIFDTLPLSLMSRQTVASLGAVVGADLGVGRFRPNLVVEAAGNDAYPEDAWVGSVLQIGTSEVRIDAQDPRCVMVNVDPTTAERDPRVLRAVVKERNSCLGVYATTVRPGRVTVGDEIRLLAQASAG